MTHATTDTIGGKGDIVLDLVREHEERIDRACVNLYPATNVMSDAACSVMGSTIATRVAEGEVGHKFQTGVTYIEKLEEIAMERTRQLFHASYAECRLLSGSMANASVFNAFTEPGDTIIALSTPAGGHISHNKIGLAGYRRLVTHHFPFDAEAMNVSLDGFAETVQTLKPKIVILGGSVLLFPQPVREIKEALAGTGTLLMFDMAHVDGLIAGKAFPNPLDEGADVATGSTYKTFPGPQRGIAVCNDKAIYDRIKKAWFPGMSASGQYNTLAAYAITCGEMLKYGEEYAAQVVRNARAFARALDGQGIKVLGKSKGYTETHQVILDVTDLGGGHDCSRRLESASIICNKNLLPWDPARLAGSPNGLRLGVQECTRLGMKEGEMERIAAWFGDVLVRRRSPADVATEVREFRRGYQRVRFC